MCPTAGCRGEPRVGSGLVVPVEEGRVYGRRGRLRGNSRHREQCLVRLVSGQRVGDERVEALGPLGAASTPRVYAEPPQPRHPYVERAVEISGRWRDFSSTDSPTSARRPYASAARSSRPYRRLCSVSPRALRWLTTRAWQRGRIVMLTANASDT